MFGFIRNFLSSWIKKQRSRKRERTDRLDANTTPRPWQSPTDEWRYVSLQFKANHIKSAFAINVCFKRFSVCACACSTKELVQLHPTAQVTFLYSRIGRRQRAACVWFKALGFPWKERGQGGADCNAAVMSSCCSDFNWVSWEKL